MSDFHIALDASLDFRRAGNRDRGDVGAEDAPRNTEVTATRAVDAADALSSRVAGVQPLGGSISNLMATFTGRIEALRQLVRKGQEDEFLRIVLRERGARGVTPNNGVATPGVKPRGSAIVESESTAPSLPNSTGSPAQTAPRELASDTTVATPQDTPATVEDLRSAAKEHTRRYCARKRVGHDRNQQKGTTVATTAETMRQLDPNSAPSSVELTPSPTPLDV